MTRTDTPAASALVMCGTGRRPHPRGTDDAQGLSVGPHLVERDQLPLHLTGDTQRLGLADAVTVVLAGPQPAQRQFQRGDAGLDTDGIEVLVGDEPRTTDLDAHEDGVGVQLQGRTRNDRTRRPPRPDRKSTRLNSSHMSISY